MNAKQKKENGAHAPLTEAELLAAPDDDYMSPRQLAFFRARLVAERDVLLAAAKNTTDELQNDTATADPNDRASQEEDHTIELRVRDRERKMLHKIDEAIARIDEGEYGWCKETGEPIGIARLLARPTATYCVEAQERHEQRRKMQGG